jgi:hypothetical protein
VFSSFFRIREEKSSALCPSGAAPCYFSAAWHISVDFSYNFWVVLRTTKNENRVAMRIEGHKISLEAQFNRECWDDVEFVWNRKPFIRTTVAEVMHHPIVDNLDTVNQSLLHKAYAMNAIPADNDALLLRHPISSWKEEVLLSVTKPLPDADNVELTGTFRSRVFEGKKTQLRSFFRQMEGFLETRNERPVAYYVSKMANTHNHNNEEICTYVIIAQVANMANHTEPLDVDRWFPFM